MSEARRRVLVTGGGRGVGAAIVRALAASGCDVDFTYRSSADEAGHLAAEVRAAWPSATVTARPIDLSDRPALELFAGEVEEIGFSGFVHNAGQSYDALAATLSQDRAETAMQVNFWAGARLAKAVLRPMIRARDGRIVFIGSVAALRGNSGNAAYAAVEGSVALV
jgi:NAD(P)-dependent dehydrogenase (short-subunit alcohol dehydrogenase family)